uniref:Uncharacterized protein n=1 Tax=Arundo donax TaxID=35708 RepID=A0A0A9BF88_ARUDO
MCVELDVALTKCSWWLSTEVRRFGRWNYHTNDMVKKSVNLSVL